MPGILGADRRAGGVVFELGSSLREARQRRGLDLDDVADRIMIRARYLAAIEDERFHLLPHGSYRRSFLREYAEFLGLDGDLYVDEYIARHEAGEPEPVLVPSRSRPRVGAAVNVVLVVAVAAVLGAVVWGLGGSEPKRTALPEPTPAPTQTVTRSTPSPHPRRVAPPPRPGSVTFTATRGRCWLSVHVGSLDGPTVYERTLDQGQTARFGLKKPLWIRLGAPQNLDAAIGGTRVADLPTSVATVKVTAVGVAVE